MNFWTDGGCKPGGRGAWAFVCEDGFEAYGRVSNTTNNRTELLAVIKALEYAASKGYADVMVMTDSQLTMYCAQGLWRLSSNKDLWDRYKRCSVKPKFTWVRGHNGDPGNERADELCRLAMTKSRRPVLKPALRNAQLSLDGMSALHSVHEQRTAPF